MTDTKLSRFRWIPKMMIVGQDFRQPLASHHLHRDAIREAIMLVRAGLVQRKRIEEARAGLRHDGDMRIVQHSADEAHSTRAKSWSGGAVEGEKFRQHLIGGVEMILLEPLAKGSYPCIPLVSGTELRDPIEGIDEVTIHG